MRKNILCEKVLDSFKVDSVQVMVYFEPPAPYKNYTEVCKESRMSVIFPYLKNKNALKVQAHNYLQLESFIKLTQSSCSKSIIHFFQKKYVSECLGLC